MYFWRNVWEKSLKAQSTNKTRQLSIGALHFKGEVDASTLDIYSSKKTVQNTLCQYPDYNWVLYMFSLFVKVEVANAATTSYVLTQKWN